MPVQVVNLSLVAQTGAVPQPTYTDVGIVGTADSSPPDANFGEVNRYTDAQTVEDDYGSNSDVATAAANAFEMGVAYLYVMVLEETQTTETLADGDTASNTPILGTPTPTAGSGTLSFVAGSPNTGGLSAGEHELNTDTGEFATGDSDADITYSYVDWNLQPFTDVGVNRLIAADRRMGREHVGTLDEIVGFAGSNRMGVVAAGVNLPDTDEDTVRGEYHDVGGYVSSGDLLWVAHKSSDDVAAYIAGQLGINDPWFDPFYDGDGYPFNTEYFQDAQVGDPASGGTFEGGDSANQSGPTNVIINKSGTQVLSNSLTTAGSSSSYQYFDVAMTQNYIASEVERVLESLRLRVDQIPFTATGRAQIRSTIVDILSANTGRGDPLANFSVTVPPRADLSDSQVANRVWSDIQIDATLAGNVHEFSMELVVSV